MPLALCNIALKHYTLPHQHRILVPEPLPPCCSLQQLRASFFFFPLASGGTFFKSERAVVPFTNTFRSVIAPALAHDMASTTKPGIGFDTSHEIERGAYTYPTAINHVLDTSRAYFFN